MKLSTKGRYITRALLDLAYHQTEELILLKDIARRQEISLSYLEHLVAPLIAAGILRSSRGPAGGIQLFNVPHEMEFSEVILDLLRANCSGGMYYQSRGMLPLRAMRYPGNLE